MFLEIFLPDMTKVEAAFSAVRKKNAPWLVTSEMRNAFDYAQEQVADIDMLVNDYETIKPIVLDAGAGASGFQGAIPLTYDLGRQIHRTREFQDLEVRVKCFRKVAQKDFDVLQRAPG